MGRGGKTMNLFERILRDNDPIICDICGKTMIAIHGGGWDNDIIYCPNKDCGAEIVFPTTTEYMEK